MMRKKKKKKDLYEKNNNLFNDHLQQFSFIIETDERKNEKENKRKRELESYSFFYVLSGYHFIVYCVQRTFFPSTVPFNSCKPKPHDSRFCNTRRIHAAQFP